MIAGESIKICDDVVDNVKLQVYANPQAEVEDPQLTLKQRYRMRQWCNVDRTDGSRTGCPRQTEITNADVTNFTGTDDDDFIALLKKIYDHAKATVGLISGESVPALDADTHGMKLEITASPADGGTTTLANRYTMTQRVPIDRTDGMPARSKSVTTPITNAAITDFTGTDDTDFVALLKKVYDSSKDAMEA